ncbi:MAG: ATP-binding cassette domain-containing protein, partial [Bacteroidales bacterium]|nr:ATP-binding cassette domain-containing protein [Bacteroidales bacterium]
MFLETQHIEKSFGTYRALDDINIGVREGTVFGLLGPNGAGKTTLIRLINRIARPDGGRILLGGHEMTDDDVRQIGYL